MSSSGERFRIGARVDAADGRCGSLTRVIIDPAKQSLTELVVTSHHQAKHSRLVPVDFVEAVENDVIRLRCTKHEFDQLDSAEDVEFLMSADTDPSGFGGEYAEWPFYEIAHGADRPGRHDPLYSDRIPVDEVEISRGDPVLAKDGRVGVAKGLVVDAGDHKVTHVLLEEGHLPARREVAIPIGAATRIDDEVRLELTKDQIADLPAVRHSLRH